MLILAILKKNLLKLFFTAAVFLFICISCLTYSQQNNNTAPVNVPAADTLQESVYVTPEKDFSAGWLHSMIFGKHWRELWTTPVKVPVLDLENYQGGLDVLPSDNSGGKQSKVLKFSSKDGKMFKFRSTLKFAKFAIDPELKGTIAEYIVQDQVSIKHPFAPVIAFRLLKSAGVLMPEPTMYVLPYDQKLDANYDFKGLLGTLQEIPVKKKPYPKPNVSTI